MGYSKMRVKYRWMLKTVRLIPSFEHLQLHSHIHALDRIIPKTDDNRCSVYANVSGLACEDFCVRLHPRNITFSKDRVAVLTI